MKVKAKKAGFTLIELLIVIAILGVLAAAVLVAINPGKRSAQARDAIRKSNLSSLSRALDTYFVDHLVYPSSGCISSYGNPAWRCWWDETFAGYIFGPTGSGYVKKMPLDPKNLDAGTACSNTLTTDRLYAYYGGGQSAALYGRLENLDDPSINYNGNDVGTCTGWANYKISKL